MDLTRTGLVQFSVICGSVRIIEYMSKFYLHKRLYCLSPSTNIQVSLQLFQNLRIDTVVVSNCSCRIRTSYATQLPYRLLLFQCPIGGSNLKTWTARNKLIGQDKIVFIKSIESRWRMGARLRAFRWEPKTSGFLDRAQGSTYLFTVSQR